MRLWPFSCVGMTETLAWATDLFRAKAREQRIALRTAPRRTLSLEHVLKGDQATAARRLVAAQAGGDGFIVPDWGHIVQGVTVLAGSANVIEASLDAYHFGDLAFIRPQGYSATAGESTDISISSAGAELGAVAQDYIGAMLMPAWPAIMNGGLDLEAVGTNVFRATAEFELQAYDDISASTYTPYRGLDILPTCPVIGGGSLADGIEWPVTKVDNVQSIPELIRQRTIPDQSLTMRWQEKDTAEKFALRQWIYSRRGRQKAFWFSSWLKDFQPAADIAGNTAMVYAPGDLPASLYGPFHIEVVAGGAVHHRYVSAVTDGPAVSGRQTLNLALDSALGVLQADIRRISILRCARFDADRIEIDHRPGQGIRIEVPCLEILEP